MADENITNTRLEVELIEAKDAIEALEEQKNENLQLKETIDRLRLDLDELRTQARANAEIMNKSASSTLSRSTSGRESVPVTLSKNLGRELARRFADQNADDEEVDEKREENKAGHEAEESYEEEIVTTRRRLVCCCSPPCLKRDILTSLCCYARNDL
jgi:hypothetical protein